MKNEPFDNELQAGGATCTARLAECSFAVQCEKGNYKGHLLRPARLHRDNGLSRPASWDHGLG